MYKAISDQIINRLSSKTDLAMEYRDIYSYALEKYISGLINTIMFTAVALLLRIPLETAVFFVFYAPLRKYAGGIHARTRLQCTVLSMIVLFALIYAAKAFSMTRYWILIAAAGVIYSVISVVLFAPVDSVKRRLSKDTRRRFRYFSIGIVLSESLMIILGIGFLSSQKELILTAVMALLLSGILIVPYNAAVGRRNGGKYEEKGKKQPVD